jgi:hypothetical protein
MLALTRDPAHQHWPRPLRPPHQRTATHDNTVPCCAVHCARPHLFDIHTQFNSFEKVRNGNPGAAAAAAAVVATDSYVAASGDWCDGGTRAIATAGGCAAAAAAVGLVPTPVVRNVDSAMLPAGCYYKREVPTLVLPLPLHATDLIWLDGAFAFAF